MGKRGTSRRLVSASTAILAAGVLLGSGAVEVGARPIVELRQVDDEGSDPASSSLGSSAVGDVVGARPTVSGDGRFVAFQGAPPVSDGVADSRTSTVYVTDRQTGETTEITPVPDDLTRSGNSVFPVISGDGCVVVTITEMALDVFRDDDNGARWDVYRSALPHCGGSIGNWELLSTRNGTGGLARDDVVLSSPTVNRSATLIAYTHPADHLYEADGVNTVSLVDLAVPVNDAARSRFVAGMPSDSPNTVFTHAGIDQPALSDDGSHLAYRSDATSADAVPGWGVGKVDGGPATSQVFVWKIAEPDPFLAVQLVSTLPDGTPTLDGAAEPAISRDGSSIAFTSPDRALLSAEYSTCADQCPAQVYLLDRDADDDGQIGPADIPSLSIVSAFPESMPPVAGNSSSSQPTISADGQLVAFVSRATNLQLIQPPGYGSGDDGEILVAEIHRGALTRATTDRAGVVPTAGVHAHPDLDDTGRTTVYDTAGAIDLLSDETTAGGRRVVAKSSPPRLALADADLGTTLVGLQSDEWYVSVINDGPATFQPAELSIDNPQFTIIDDSDYNTCFLGAAVPAGGNCTVAVHFTPSRSGSTSATMTVSEVGFGAVRVSATISGSGGQPSLIIKPAGIDFPEVTVGDRSIELQVDVANIAIVTTGIKSFDITGEHAGDFEITSNNCLNRPINPRASCSVGLTFTPTDAGRRTALFGLVTVSGQTTTAIIAGDGAFAPEVELDATSVEAGREFVATGRRYPANTEVTVVFGDRPGQMVTTVTDEVGNFSVPVPVSSTERGGARTVVVQTTSGAAASAPVDVIEADQQWVGMPGFGLG